MRRERDKAPDVARPVQVVLHAEEIQEEYRCTENLLATPQQSALRLLEANEGDDQGQDVTAFVEVSRQTKGDTRGCSSGTRRF